MEIEGEMEENEGDRQGLRSQRRGNFSSLLGSHWSQSLPCEKSEKQFGNSDYALLTLHTWPPLNPV